MAAVWNLWCNFRKDLALHCEHKYHYSLRFVPTFRKKAYGILRDDFFSLILSRELLLWTRAHTTSIWNFTIQWTSHDDLTEKSADIFHFKHQTKKLVKWQKFKTALCNLTKKLFRRISYLYKSTLVLKKKFSVLQFNVPIQDGSIGEASAADISYYYYYILLTCIITQPILAHPPIKLPTQLGPLPLLITEKKYPP